MAPSTWPSFFVVLKSCDRWSLVRVLWVGGAGACACAGGGACAERAKPNMVVVKDSVGEEEEETSDGID